MRLLAAWFANPIEYWPNILCLIVLVAVAVFVIRKIQAKSKTQKQADIHLPLEPVVRGKAAISVAFFFAEIEMFGSLPANIRPAKEMLPRPQCHSCDDRDDFGAQNFEMYPILAGIFFINIIVSVILILGWIIRPKIWRRNLPRIKLFCTIWFVPYLIFILFFTGPEDLSQYPPQESSHFKLPWQAGVTRFVSQGNRGFTNHRGLHLCAWDFAMPISTPVLASGDGEVVHVEMGHEGIGFKSNYIAIEHDGGVRTGYAHLKKDSAFVKVGDHVRQGQIIALSGMTGQTLFPHLHFVVTDQTGMMPKPISFRDVPGGVPFAGHFYTSDNTAQ